MEPKLVNIEPILILANSPEETLMCIIQEVPEDPGHVGIMLADAARHFALAYEQQGMDRKDALMQIWNLLVAEMNNPTDEIFAVSIPPEQLRFVAGNDDE